MRLQSLEISCHCLYLNAQALGIDGHVTKTVLQLFISAGKIWVGGEFLHYLLIFLLFLIVWAGLSLLCFGLLLGFLLVHIRVIPGILLVRR